MTNEALTHEENTESRLNSNVATVDEVARMLRVNRNRPTRRGLTTSLARRRYSRSSAPAPDGAMNASDPATGFMTAVKEAVKHTVRLLRERHPGETLAGYALLTDDGLGTLLYLAVTREVLQSSPDPDLLFTQTDWPFEDGIDAFDGPAAQLRWRAGEDAFEQHVDNAFADLVQALAELRSENLFGADVFLSVASTDPSEHLLRLEEAAIIRLNSPQISRARREFLQKWQ